MATKKVVFSRRPVEKRADPTESDFKAALEKYTDASPTLGTAINSPASSLSPQSPPALPTVPLSQSSSVNSKPVKEFSLSPQDDEEEATLLSRNNASSHADAPSEGHSHSHSKAEKSCGDDSCSSGGCGKPMFTPEEQEKIDQFVKEKQEEAQKLQEQNEAEISKKSSETTLTGSIFRSDVEELIRLLAAGRDPDELDESGEHCALHHAAFRSDIACAAELLKAGADPNIPNMRGETPLMWACKKNYIPMLHLLVTHGANINVGDASGLLPIHHAADAGHILNLDFLFMYGADLNAKDGLNKTTVMWAAYRNHTRTLIWLLEQGVDGTAVDADGYTFMHWASSQGHGQLLRQAFIDRPELSKLGLKPNKKGLNAIEIAEQKANAFPVRAMGRLHRAAGEAIRATAATHVLSHESYFGLIAKLFALIRFLRGPLVMYWAIFLAFGSYFTCRYMVVPTMSFPLFNIIFCVFFVVGMYNWIRVLFGEPGGLVANAKPLEGRLTFDELHEEYQNKLKTGVLVHENHCSTCRIIRPLRSKHCSTCKRCVLKFDHHCPFLDQDIAAGNYHNFLAFVACQFIMIANYFCQTIYWMSSFTHEDGTSVSFADVIGLHPVPTIFSLHYGIYIIIPLMLVLQHWKLMSENITTNEEINSSKYPYLWLKGYFSNPYSRGTWNNILISMGMQHQNDYVSVDELIADNPSSVPAPLPTETRMEPMSGPKSWFGLTSSSSQPAHGYTAVASNLEDDFPDDTEIELV